MKKILVNAYLNLNFGDDLFLKILFDRYSNVKWILPYSGTEKYNYVLKKYENVKIKQGLTFKIKKKLMGLEKNSKLNRYDAGVFIGGSIFMEIPRWRYQITQKKAVVNSFYKEDKPYFILGANFGPYNSDNFLEEHKELFKECKDICFRDSYSKMIFSDYDNVRLAPDIVFQLKPKNVKKIENSVGMSLINLSDREDLKEYTEIYNKKIGELIEQCVKTDKKVYLFSFCKNEGDVDAINNILNTIDKELINNVEIVNYDGDIEKFLEKFESMENIIGTRFHACILSQVFNQGLYPILYSNKTYNVLKDIRLDKEYTFIKDLENLDVKHVMEVISNNKIKDKSIFKESERQFEELDKYVRS